MTQQQLSKNDVSDRTKQLGPLGWDDHFERRLMPLDTPYDRIGRIFSAQRNLFLVNDGHTEQFCSASGRLQYGLGLYPVTGDWVLCNEGVITHVLPRKNMLGRGEAGSRGKRGGAAPVEQAIGANLDAAFIVCGLDRDYNPRRIERYLTLIYNCGISPVIVLTKADLHDSPDTFRQEVEDIAFGVPIVLSSMQDPSAADALLAYLHQGRTAAMLGSSGAGKSTLANLLCGGNVRATGATSDSSGKGRHTTTARELISMPHGGLLMDNPGIRELAFHTDGDGLDAAFPDIEALSVRCRFADCAHQHEPGCAVLQAVESGELSRDRLESYRKMRRELEYVSARSEKSADRVEKERWKDVALRIRRMKKHR